MATNIGKQKRVMLSHRIIAYSLPHSHYLFCPFYVASSLFFSVIRVIMGIDVTVGRIVLGMHWASDVIVGILISTVLVWCAFKVIERRLLLKS